MNGNERALSVENRFRKNTFIQRRTLIILGLFGVFALVLIGRLFFLQVVSHDKYRMAVIENVEQQYSVSAPRGDIYDRNGTLIATSITTWRIFLDPQNIVSMDKILVDGGGEKISPLIASTLSELLSEYGAKYDDVLARAGMSHRRDETIARNVMKDDADLVRQFIAARGLERQIYLQETSTRYYPQGELAAQVWDWLYRRI